jgi:hypothetical protein
LIEDGEFEREGTEIERKVRKQRREFVSVAKLSAAVKPTPIISTSKPQSKRGF